jgi:hypothetical protein
MECVAVVNSARAGVRNTANGFVVEAALGGRRFLMQGLEAGGPDTDRPAHRRHGLAVRWSHSHWDGRVSMSSSTSPPFPSIRWVSRPSQIPANGFLDGGNPRTVNAELGATIGVAFAVTCR